MGVMNTSAYRTANALTALIAGRAVRRVVAGQTYASGVTYGVNYDSNYVRTSTGQSRVVTSNVVTSGTRVSTHNESRVIQGSTVTTGTRVVQGSTVTSGYRLLSNQVNSNVI